jgi:hypothetical protein
VRWTVAKKKETPKPKPEKSKPAKSKPEPKEKTVADENKPQQQQNPPGVVGGPADDTSVRGMFDKCKEVATDVMSGDYIGALQSAKTVLSVGFDLLGLPNIFGAGREGAEVSDAEVEEVKKSLEECKAKAEAPGAKGAGAGDAGADGAGVVPPELIALAIQLMLSLIDAIRKRRHPTTP